MRCRDFLQVVSVVRPTTLGIRLNNIDDCRGSDNQAADKRRLRGRLVLIECVAESGIQKVQDWIALMPGTAAFGISEIRIVKLGLQRIEKQSRWQSLEKVLKVGTVRH